MNLQNSGIHEPVVFQLTSVSSLDSVFGAIKPCGKLITPKVLAQILIEAKNSALKKAKDRFRDAIEKSTVIYKLTSPVKPNLELIARLNLYCASIEEGYEEGDRYSYANGYYLIDQGDGNDCYCSLEAYQALVYKTADPQSCLLKSPAIFIDAMGQDLYEECIIAITTDKSTTRMEENNSSNTL